MKTVKIYKYQEQFQSCKLPSTSNLNKKNQNYKSKNIYKNFDYIKSIYINGKKHI